LEEVEEEEQEDGAVQEYRFRQGEEADRQER
jgi:hypothetical protein